MSSTALSLRSLQPTTVPPGPGRPARPSLRVLDGGRAPARVAQQAVYRRRRLAVALVAVVVVALSFLLASAAVAGNAGGDPSSAAGTSAAASTAADAATVVVQPGDTLWSIAAATQPEVDVRIAVDRLVALNGRSPLVVGQELVLPG
jgi:LysM repeat protein